MLVEPSVSAPYKWNISLQSHSLSSVFMGGAHPLRKQQFHLCFVCAAGGFGVDFSLATDDFKSGIDLVSQKILSHGVTSFCPTLVTSPPSVYHQVRGLLSHPQGDQGLRLVSGGGWAKTGIAARAEKLWA